VVSDPVAPTRPADLVACPSGGFVWHRVVAHDRGATFESRCGELRWPIQNIDGLRLSHADHLPSDAKLCPLCFVVRLGRNFTHRRFLLVRSVDVSGVSGTGVVAEGVEFTSGQCVLAWTTEFASVAVYGSIADVVHIHGHGGATAIEWVDE
jgi:hypothetical protein